MFGNLARTFLLAFFFDEDYCFLEEEEWTIDPDSKKVQQDIFHFKRNKGRDGCFLQRSHGVSAGHIEERIGEEKKREIKRRGE